MTTITATTILRSRNTSAPGKVLSTLLLRYPRCIHAELMTHRVFSRNAASSRAIPVEKLIQDAIDNPFVPVFWGKNQKGMQATEEVTPEEVEALTIKWLAARDQAIEVAKGFVADGLHKQIVNRVLEPFTHITVLVSATEWDNFLELRDHPDAEPHIQLLAKEIRKCLEDDLAIEDLIPGQWHLPFYEETDGIMSLENAIKLSVSRCASTSYKTVDGFDMTLERAIAIHDKLIDSKPMHASPAEHVAMADGWKNPGVQWTASEQHGNFVGFRQYRHML